MAAPSTVDQWTFSGKKADCPRKPDRPAEAEDAESLSYKETCVGNQLKIEYKMNNTWDPDYCPSEYRET